MPSRPLDRAPRVSWSGHPAYVYIKMRNHDVGVRLTPLNFLLYPVDSPTRDRAASAHAHAASTRIQGRVR